MAGYDAPAMSEPNTPQDPSSAPHWDPAEPGADASGLASDATQLWDPSEVPTSVVTSAGVDAAAAAAAAAPTAFDAPAPWELPAQAAPVTPPFGAAGTARGVASGRPNMTDEPPTGRKTPPAAIVGSVIGLAIVVALGAWFLLLRPGPNTALASPSPSPIVIVTPSPAASTTAEPTTEPTAEVTPLSTPAPTPFKAPTFTGKTLVQAQALAHTGGLELKIQYDRTTSQPDGTVLSQAPPAGSSVLPGDQVFLIVAKPGPNVLVPDLQGVAEADAVNLLLDSDLQPGTRTQASDAEVAAGAVISSDTVAGNLVARGSSVDYVVSSGPEPTASPTPATVLVPDVTGIDEADAFNQILDADLTPGERTEAFDPAVGPGLVIGTDPAAGAEVDRGSTVDYTVSLGVQPTPTPVPTPEPTPEPTLAPTPEPTPAPVAIPDLRGFTPDDAVNALLDVGLQPGTRSDKFNANVPDGLVIRTAPVAGTEVQPGSTVDYVVSRGPSATPTPEPTLEPTLAPTPEPTLEPTLEPTPATALVPDVHGFAEADAINTFLDQGLQPGTRTEAFDPEIGVGLVIGTDPVAGTEVDRGTPIGYVVSLGVEPTLAPTAEPTPALVTIPNLRGSNPDDAVNALLDLGLQPGQRQDRFNANVPEGQVIRTVPDAGTEVAPGTTVDYRVSLGVEPTPTLAPTPEPTPRRTRRPTPEPTVEPSTGLVTVPDVRGSTPDDAVNALLDAGLQPGTRTDRLNANVQPGLVIRTDPAAGQQVAPGTTIDYFVSRDAQPSDQPSAAPTDQPTTAPSNGSGIDPDVQAAIDAVVAQVPALRQLDPKQEVPYRLITERQFRRQVTQSFDAENPAVQVAAEETLLKRLGLLPQDADLRQMLLDLYTSQVAAFYDPKTGAMTVIKRDGTFGPEERLFVAHEYDHALQDQHWDLQKVTTVPASQGDRALAHLALVEGDATSLMLQWASQNLTADELSQVTSAMTPADQAVLDGMPEILRRQLEFPYLEGQVFVTTLLGQGGWDSVNAAWDKLPASTEQILHPEKYPSDTPVKVTLPDVAATLGRGWTASYVQTMGELDTSVLLDNGGNSSDTAAAAAAGWGGDRLVSLDGPDGSWAVVWQTAWDTSTDADEFSAAVDPAISELGGAHAVLPGTDIAGSLDNPVLVLVASSPDTLQQVEQALSVGN